MGLRDLGINVKTSQRPLDIVYVIDVSGSMERDKIQSVNYAMHELESALRDEAKKNPGAQVNIRILTFGDAAAKWHLGSATNKTPIESFRYTDINSVYGGTPLGSAFNVLNVTFSDESHIPSNSLRPIVVLLSDGLPTDNYAGNLQKFLSLRWGKKALKVAVAIGRDADREVLAEFTQDPSLVFEVNNPTALINFIRWTSSLVTHVSQPTNGDNRANIIKAAKSVLTDEGDFM